jgi:hypothetical protein
MSPDVRPPDPEEDSMSLVDALGRARKRARISMYALVLLSTIYGISESFSVVLPTLVQLCWFLR